MASKYEQMVGNDVGSMHIVGICRDGKRYYFETICNLCGKYKKVRIDELLKGKQTRCSCQVRKYKNDEHQERLYRIYWHIRDRCYNPNNDAYKNYGAKGVKMFHVWLDDFAEFKKWALSNGYASNLTIDRLNSNGNYEPSNCEWVTKAGNTRRANVGRTGTKHKTHH